MYVFRSYPTRFNKLRGITDTAQSTVKYTVIHIEAIKRVVALTGMPQGIVVIVLVRTLIETTGVCQYTEFTVYRISNSLE
jgi:hypothetical protein